jgi:hypothetical protein
MQGQEPENVAVHVCCGRILWGFHSKAPGSVTIVAALKAIQSLEMPRCTMVQHGQGCNKKIKVSLLLKIKIGGIVKKC